MILTKSADVREVLGRFNDFSLGEVIEPGMPWGTFIMTVDWEEQHRLERQLLQSAVKDVRRSTVDQGNRRGRMPGSHRYSRWRNRYRPPISPSPQFFAS